MKTKIISNIVKISIVGIDGAGKTETISELKNIFKRGGISYSNIKLVDFWSKETNTKLSALGYAYKSLRKIPLNLTENFSWLLFLPLSKYYTKLKIVEDNPDVLISDRDFLIDAMAFLKYYAPNIEHYISNKQLLIILNKVIATNKEVNVNHIVMLDRPVKNALARINIRNKQDPHETDEHLTMFRSMYFKNLKQIKEIAPSINVNILSINDEDFERIALEIEKIVLLDI